MVAAAARLREPPRARNPEGDDRRVGVEIEFAGLSVEDTARIVSELWGGSAEQEDDYRIQLRSTHLGDFTVEIDSRWVHPAEIGEADPKTPFQAWLRKELALVVGEVAGRWMPMEVVGPPIRWTALPELDRLTRALQENGAAGTNRNLLYGFGMQLNPEIVTEDPAWLSAMLRSYLVLSEGLRADIGIDRTRMILPFIQRFPAPYIQKVLQPGYRPALGELICDYLEHNPSRDRELDLLPLFCSLAPEAVKAAVPDPRVKARRTFHYRLPNSSVDDPAWGGAVEEWNRWVRVEELAEDAERLDALAEERLQALDGGDEGAWRERAAELVRG